MALNHRFILMRLRHASLRELFCRLWQGLSVLRLRWSINHGKQEAPAIPASAIHTLQMPELAFDDDHRSYPQLSAIELQHLLNSQSWDPGAAAIDIRIRWEPARLQQATILLLYSLHCKAAIDGRQAQLAAKNLILYWVDANPFLKGEHYGSAMECGLRIQAFLYTLKYAEALRHSEVRCIQQAVYWHALLISKRLSLHSSLGNHTIAEAVGLIFGGAVYRSTREGKQWLQTAIDLLTAELNHQVLPDGGPVEQSLDYHRFVLDLYWLAFDFITKNRFADVSSWRARLNKGETFLNAFTDQRGRLPSIGDSDDGFAVAPGIIPRRDGCEPGACGHTTFMNSGYSVIKTNRSVFTFDHGPLGMAPLYNHGHADALSVTFSVGGVPLLVDPGTYQYNGVGAWRHYFKGTRAHNTITIDGLDQAVQETGFIWSRPFGTGFTSHQNAQGDRLYVGQHDGYCRLKHPVKHCRVLFHGAGDGLIIKDRFQGIGTHCFQLNYHLHPEASAHKLGKWWVIENSGVCVSLRLMEDDFQVVRGSEDPKLGWVSSRYGQKSPSGTLSCIRTGKADQMVFTTVIMTSCAL